MLQKNIKQFLIYPATLATILSLVFVVTTPQAKDAGVQTDVGKGANSKQQSTSLTKDAAADWVRPEDDELKKKLTPLQYRVTRENGTERPFKNKYWDNHAEGIYVDVVSGKPLFSSRDKFDSGSGWPSFTTPLQSSNLIEKSDTSYFMDRVEVRSKLADSHLGHLFKDGPGKNGLRYCINSASLRFIPAANLEKEGYKQYAKDFQNKTRVSD